MIPTPNMALKLWNLLTDHFSHQDLLDNLNKIDQHNHTVGKGLQIPTGGIADGAITSVKIAAGAVGSGAIAPGSITPDMLAPGVVPVGTVIQWWRPSSGTPLPTGWLVCDGSAVTDHSFVGGGSISLPDLRNKFVLGASTAGVASPSTAQTPAIGATGGSHTPALPGHTHNTSGPDHAHLQTGTLAGITVSNVGSTAGGTTAVKADSMYYALKGNAGLDGTQGSTANAGAFTATSTGPTAATVDSRSAFVGLLFLMKVKNA